MLITPQANIYQVQVHFHPNAEHKFSFSGADVVLNGGTSVSIPIAAGVQLVHFTLSTQHPPGDPSTLEATFQHYPIEWTGTPELPPASCPGHWFDSKHCLLVIDNSNTSTSQISFGFRLKVSYEGNLHESHDPTIINDPPIGG